MGWDVDEYTGCVDLEFTDEEMTEVIEDYDGDCEKWVDDHFSEHDALIEDDE